MFNIRMLPAGHGDCIQIEYGTPEKSYKIQIDGGPAYSYEHLRSRINSISESKSEFEVMVITHIDCDHIDGAVKLLGAKPEGLNINDVWFNSWRHLSKQPKDIQGPVHGEMLSALIEYKKIPWNKAFNGEPIANLASDDPIEKTLPGGLNITLLSPTKKELTKLKRVWAREVREAGLEPGSNDDALRKLMEDKRLKPDTLGEETLDIDSLAQEKFEEDNSIANASSIAFLAEYEGRSCLFTGDAHPNVLESSIKSLLDERGESRLKLDALKMSHHGSSGNTSPELLKLLDCKRFLVSTNGSYFNHPNKEAIARVIMESDNKIDLYFNYQCPETKIWDNIQRFKYKYRAFYPEKNEKDLIITL